MIYICVHFHICTFFCFPYFPVYITVIILHSHFSSFILGNISSAFSISIPNTHLIIFLLICSLLHFYICTFLCSPLILPQFSHVPIPIFQHFIISSSQHLSIFMSTLFCISNIFLISLIVFMFIHFYFQICILHYIFINCQLILYIFCCTFVLFIYFYRTIQSVHFIIISI